MFSCRFSFTGRSCGLLLFSRCLWFLIFAPSSIGLAEGVSFSFLFFISGLTTFSVFKFFFFIDQSLCLCLDIRQFNCGKVSHHT